MNALTRQQARSRRRRNRNWAISLALLLVLGLGVELLLRQYALRQFDAHQQRLTARAGEVRAVLLSELNATLHLATGLASYIGARQGEVQPPELQPWLDGLLRRGRHIRNIGLAPGNRIVFVYPLAGNEAALGLYYPDLPKQWSAVQRIIASREPGLDGPLPLVQGGSGLIYRVPVFLGDGSYWGLVSTVIDFDRLYAEVERAARQLDLVIRLRHRDAADGELIKGSAVPDGAANVELTVRLAGTHWRLGASDGHAEAPQLGWLRLIGWSLALAISALIALTLHGQHRQASLLLALNHSQRQFRQAFEMAPQGLALLDPQGRLLTVNPTFCRLLGRGAEDLLDQPLARFADPQLGAGLDAVLGAADEQTVRSWQGCLFDAHGESVDVELSVAVLGHGSSGAAGWILHVQDIRESKRLQRLQNEFVATVSHELRTPLTAISGPLELIDSGALGEVPEHLQQMLQIARHNSRRLGLLINDLLDIGKLEAERMPIACEELALQPLIEQALQCNQAYAAEHGVRLHQVGVCTERVRVDGQRLQQVLSNLLANAAKFSPAEQEVEVSCERRGAWVRISVRDHGPGVAPAFHGRIFQKFAQADASDSRQRGGTGLGLAISKELIERMGGRIGFDSAEGLGATFWIELPLAEAAAQEQSA
ncbi:PAS domain S-box protein [Pseudomonas sp. LPB0260]|uniref:ATP-binding protein n=1 Tax=Pseudomonas sp. LPB0260 TaxID=2614442 RepID=UPI0015C20747|nr:ATP-binding protein [Pseudomonas sp. LPB0260]QLC72898.1 PAS domain S-box protein [Pseudomonas sp. LPB0260]QLC75672.1 PAS domain S-box protein [Pseudomonas sp. LPB0260]